MAIELWAARLERPLTPGEEQVLWKALPPWRRARMAAVRQEPLCAYFLLRRALWEQYAWRSLPDMDAAPSGKPCFPACPEVFFNLSHTRGATLVGLASRPVGVDIEHLRPINPRTAARLFPSSGKASFLPDWVRRESRAKRLGEDVGGKLRHEPPFQEGEVYYPLETFPGYFAGVAGTGEPLGALRRYESVDELLEPVAR